MPTEPLSLFSISRESYQGAQTKVPLDTTSNQSDTTIMSMQRAELQPASLFVLALF